MCCFHAKKLELLDWEHLKEAQHMGEEGLLVIIRWRCFKKEFDSPNCF
jgi:hypothetical protein